MSLPGNLSVFRQGMDDLIQRMDGTVIQAQVTIANRLGLHARPAMAFVDTASGYKADIKVAKGKQEVDGKSIMQMMMLAATQGTQLQITAAGDDAQAAIDALCELVGSKFGEE